MREIAIKLNVISFIVLFLVCLVSYIGTILNFTLGSTLILAMCILSLANEVCYILNISKHYVKPSPRNIAYYVILFLIVVASVAIALLDISKYYKIADLVVLIIMNAIPEDI